MILELPRQDVIALTNESKRKAVLSDWRSWGIWHKAPEIGLSVYRLDLPDGSFFNLCDNGGKLKAGSKAESLLTDKLKEMRKELMRDGNA